MIKSTLKDISFLGLLNWVTAHRETKKYVEIIKKLLTLLGVDNLSLSREHLSRSDFDNLNIFQS